MFRFFIKKAPPLAARTTRPSVVPPTRNTLTIGINDFPDSGPDEGGNKETTQRSNLLPEEHLWTGVEGLGNRLNNPIMTNKEDIGNLKSETNKKIGERGNNIERGFGQLRAEMRDTRATLCAEVMDTCGILRTEIRTLRTEIVKATSEIEKALKSLVWLLGMLLAGVTVVVSGFAKSYFFPNLFGSPAAETSNQRPPTPRCPPPAPIGPGAHPPVAADPRPVPHGPVVAE